MSNQSKLAVLLWSTSLLMACSSTGRLRQQETASVPGCSFDFNARTLRWRAILNLQEIALEPRVGNTRLPSKFEVYAIDLSDLDSFLKAVQAGGADMYAMRLPLPGQGGCPAFKLRSSGAMSEALSRKFPDLISLKGLSGENRNAALRLDYDGEKMEAEIRWEGQVYYLSPWPGKGGIYYLLYRKEDAGFEKKPFHPY
jgi:hypothetical protein